MKGRPLSILLPALVMVAGGAIGLRVALAPTGGHAANAKPATPCDQVVLECHVERLANLTLTGPQTSGALRSVDGFDMSGIISFDEALRRGWIEAHFDDAKTIQVILGSADASKLQWGQGNRLFYAIDWEGVCVPGIGGPRIGPSPFPGYSPRATPRCSSTHWSTVLDARTGDFIVEGT